MGLDVNFISEKDRRTPQEIVVTNHKSSMIKLLLDCRANIHRKHSHRDRVLHLASGRRGTEAIVIFCNLLLFGADPMARKRRGVTALDCTWGHGVDLAIVRRLLEWGADADATSADGWTALHVASAAKNVLSVKLLLEKVVDVNVWTNSGVMTLYCACASSCKAIVRLLLNRWADVTVRGSNGHMALHVAVLYRTPTIVHMLLTSDKDINTTKSDFTTALHLATEVIDDVKIMQILLRNENNYHTTDTEGWTALHSVCCYSEDTGSVR